MIKKYQMKNGPKALTNSGHILPEILTKSDKKLANMAEASKQNGRRQRILNMSHSKPKMIEALQDVNVSRVKTSNTTHQATQDYKNKNYGTSKVYS